LIFHLDSNKQHFFSFLNFFVGDTIFVRAKQFIVLEVAMAQQFSFRTYPKSAQTFDFNVSDSSC